MTQKLHLIDCFFFPSLIDLQISCHVRQSFSPAISHRTSIRSEVLSLVHLPTCPSMSGDTDFDFSTLLELRFAIVQFD